MSDAAVAVSLPAWGASVEAAISAVRPCCHAGADAGAGAAVVRGEGGAVCAQPVKALIAISEPKRTIFFIIEKPPLIKLCTTYVCMLTSVMMGLQRVSPYPLDWPSTKARNSQIGGAVRFFAPPTMVVICSALKRATAEDRTWSCGHVCFTVKSQRACTYVQALEFFGSSTWARTRDLRINSPALYQLSY